MEGYDNDTYHESQRYAREAQANLRLDVHASATFACHLFPKASCHLPVVHHNPRWLPALGVVSDFTFLGPWPDVPRPAILAMQIKVMVKPEATTLKVQVISSPW